MRRVKGIAAGAVLAATGLATAACMQGNSAAGAGGSASDTANLTTANQTTEPSVPVTSGSATPGTPGTPADGQAVAAAFARTVSAGSAKIATSTEVGAGQQSLPITASGVIGFANRSADLNETLPAGQGAGETRFVNGLLYERLPGSLVSKLSNGKPWISLDLAKLSQQGDGSLQQLLTDSPSDPSTVLGFMRGADTQVTTVGPDTVDGVPTTHYDVVLDLDKAAAGQDAQVQQSTHSLEQELGTHTLPAQVWLDAQGRLRKISMNETLSTAAMSTPTATAGTKPPGQISFQFTATLSDFGVPVTVTAPPAAQTVDLTSKLSGGH
jgi:hypothetical protein